MLITPTCVGLLTERLPRAVDCMLVPPLTWMGHRLREFVPHGAFSFSPPTIRYTHRCTQLLAGIQLPVPSSVGVKCPGLRGSCGAPGGTRTPNPFLRTETFGCDPVPGFALNLLGSSAPSNQRVYTEDYTTGASAIHPGQESRRSERRPRSAVRRRWDG